MNSQLQLSLKIILLLSYLFVTGCSTAPSRAVPVMPILQVEKETADSDALNVNSGKQTDIQVPANETDTLTASVPRQNPGGTSLKSKITSEPEEIMIPFKIVERNQIGGRLSINDYQEAVVTIIASAGHGTGFIISEDGYVLTNQHITDSANMVNVKLRSGREVRGEVIRTNTIGDVALIKLEKDLYPSVSLGNSLLLAIGEEVHAIGTPSEEESSQTVTKGVVGSFRMENGLRFIQSNVRVHKANSGGPLVSLQNGVVGICTTGQSFPSSTAEAGLNQFIPIEDAITMLHINNDKIAIQNIAETM